MPDSFETVFAMYVTIVNLWPPKSSVGFNHYLQHEQGDHGGSVVSAAVLVVAVAAVAVVAAVGGCSSSHSVLGSDPGQRDLDSSFDLKMKMIE